MVGKNFKIMFFLALFAGRLLNGNEPMYRLANHIFMLQELKQYFLGCNQTPVLNPVQLPHQTPTQAHLSFPDLKQRLEHYWPGCQNKYKTMIDTMIKREKCYQSGYYVFYHAQPGYFRILHDFLKEWYRLLHIKEELNEFNFLRIWSKAMPKADVIQFLDDNHYINDAQAHMSEKLLSVNLSLFGNLTYLGECTFSYYVNNSTGNCIGSNVKYFLQQLFAHYSIDQSFVDPLYNLMVEASQASLMQIFIPKHLTDKCVYVCHAYGTHYTKQLIAGDHFDKKRGWYTKISPILELYQKSPKLLDSTTFDQLQARIILSQDIMLNPNSGVKIFRHASIDDKKLQEYQKNLKELVRKIFINYLESHNSTVEDQSSLAVLIQQINRNNN